MGLLLQMAFCPRLWVADRSFPTVPAFGFLPPLPQMPTVLISVSLVVAVIVVAVLPARGPVYATLVLGAALVLFDVTRLQPWFYQYLLFFVALALVRGGLDRVWAVCAFIIAGTYFWSGLQKLNASFAVTTFPFMLHPFGLERLQPLWIVAALTEFAIGVCLLTPRCRSWALAGAIAMHGFVLVALGPLGQNVNAVVWPWNLFLPVMASILFFGNREAVLRSAWNPAAGKVVVLLVGMLPALNVFGLWDDYLSASLYSGKAREAYILLTPAGKRLVPERVRPFVYDRNGRIGLDVIRWAMGDLNVPPYPEPRVYRRVAQRLNEDGVSLGEMQLLVSNRMAIFTSKKSFSQERIW